MRLDLDGKADVIGCDSTGRLLLYPGNGKGGWETRKQIDAGQQGFDALIG